MLIPKKNIICNELINKIFKNNLGMVLFSIIFFIINYAYYECEVVEEIEPSISYIFS